MLFKYQTYSACLRILRRVVIDILQVGGAVSWDDGGSVPIPIQIRLWDERNRPLIEEITSLIVPDDIPVKIFTSSRSLN